MNFFEFGLHDKILDGLDAMGFSEATPVQEKAIPEVLAKRDIVAIAQTGTGKTAAYLLPIMHHILEDEAGDTIQALIIAPTRELALQIDQQLEGLAYFSGVSSSAVYGGGDGDGFSTQKKALTQGANIIIATPGKLISHLNLGYVNLSHLKHFVLDEADRMLDMGFYEDIMRIYSHIPHKAQTLLFSATMPPKIRTLAERILQNPVEVSIAISKPAENAVQAAFLVYNQQKIDLIKYLLRDGDIPSLIIFSSTKNGVKEIEKTLQKEGFSARGIQSDLEQKEREEIMREFRNGKLNILVATDIVSRGIDVEEIAMVINFDVPHDPEDYIHRIGRTARAGSSGEAITFINDDSKDQYRFHRIEQLIGKEIRKVALPPHLGSGPAYSPFVKKKGSGNKKKFKPRQKGGERTR